MANKLFLVSATLAFFFILTNASIYRTIVEFDEQLPAGPLGPKERLCTKDFRQSEHLRACQQWVHKQAQQGPQYYLEDGFENPQGPQQRPPLLQKCCQELHKESEVCVCPTLEEVARAVIIQSQQRQQGQQGQHGSLQSSRIYQTAKNLPNVCNIQGVGVCPFQIIPSYY